MGVGGELQGLVQRSVAKQTAGVGGWRQGARAREEPQMVVLHSSCRLQTGLSTRKHIPLTLPILPCILVDVMPL